MQDCRDWSVEEKQRARAAIDDLAEMMRAAASESGLPQEQVDELLGKIASLAPDLPEAEDASESG